MKFTLIALLAIAAATQGFVLYVQNDVELQGNIIDNLISEALEFVRPYLKGPITFPDVPEQTISGPDMNVKVKVVGFTLSKADDFVVEHIENNLPQLSAKFQVKSPQPHMEGQFSIEGVAFSKNVNGQGKFTIDLTNMDQSGQIQLGLKDHGVYVKELALDYTLANAEVNATGLTVEGMTEDQLRDFLNQQLVPLLNKNKAEVCQKVAAEIVEKANTLMAGKSLKDLIDMLKKYIGH